MRKIIAAAVGAAFASLFAISSALADSVTDPWSTGAPPDPQWEAMAIPLLSADLVTVPEDMQPAALKLLNKKSIVAISAAEAAKLMGGAPPPAAAPATPATTPPQAATPGPVSPDAPATPDTSTAAAAADTSAAPAATSAAAPAAGPAKPAAAASADQKLKPYLVRGILLPGAQGGFTAEHRDNALWVSYNGLSGTAPKPVHKALIVFLATPPATVYVTADYLD